MGRGRDVNDVDVGPSEDLAEVTVALDPGAGDRQGLVEMAAVDVAHGEEPRAGVAEMGAAHAADADDGPGQLVARGREARAAEDAAGDDGKGRRGGGRAAEKTAAAQGTRNAHVALLAGIIQANWGHTPISSLNWGHTPI